MTIPMGRYEAETKTGIPAYPCPLCGHDSWTAYTYKPAKPVRLTLVVCNHCRVGQDAHWVDGCWSGMHHYSKHPGSLVKFIEEHSQTLRAES